MTDTDKQKPLGKRASMKLLREYMAEQGRKGGKAGRGAAKRRGNADHYKALSQKAATARKARKEHKP